MKTKEPVRHSLTRGRLWTPSFPPKASRSPSPSRHKIDGGWRVQKRETRGPSIRIVTPQAGPQSSNIKPGILIRSSIVPLRLPPKYQQASHTLLKQTSQFATLDNRFAVSHTHSISDLADMLLITFSQGYGNFRSPQTPGGCQRPGACLKSVV